MSEKIKVLLSEEEVDDCIEELQEIADKEVVSALSFPGYWYGWDSLPGIGAFCTGDTGWLLLIHGWTYTEPRFQRMFIV